MLKISNADLYTKNTLLLTDNLKVNSRTQRVNNSLLQNLIWDSRRKKESFSLLQVLTVAYFIVQQQCFK